jgi:hypothetical protein
MFVYKKNYSTATYSFLTIFNENAVIRIVLLFQYTRIIVCGAYGGGERCAQGSGGET